MAVLGIGVIEFEGTTTFSGAGAFGAGLSPIQFQSVVTGVPGSAIAAFGSSKRGSSSGGGGCNPSTFVTTLVPVQTGPTGGFGAGSGLLDIASTTTGMKMMGMFNGGAGSSVGTAANFGGGTEATTSLFGTAGGLGSGAGSGAATGYLWQKQCSRVSL
jgi:hypothetical protein